METNMRLVGHTPRVSKRGQDTKWDAGRGMEEIHEFCFKEFAVVRSIPELSVPGCSCNIPYPHPCRTAVRFWGVPSLTPRSPRTASYTGSHKSPAS